MKAPDTIQVEVWDYNAQHFIESFRCPGERRVRVDRSDLENLAIFAVIRNPDGPEFHALDGNSPLRDWTIDRT